MGENSLINLGELSKPATVLVEKIYDAVGGIFRPCQIKRVAKAEAEAEIIRTQSQIEVTDLRHRAIARFITEESQKQNNIENITAKAIPQLKNSARPNDVENDWITNFFDKCRIISDDEMQSLWGKVLAGEANAPGTYSKRTVNLLGSLDKTDASLFTALCGFGWFIQGEVVPLIFDIRAQIYNNAGLDFSKLSHLDNIGLVNFDTGSNFTFLGLPKKITVFYVCGTPLNIEFKKESDNELQTGQTFLTKTGQQLAFICGAQTVAGFQDYIMERWIKEGLILSSPYPRKQ